MGVFRIKSFSLDSNGDVEIKNNKIVIANAQELIVQKIQKMLSTNKNEWFDNSNEGINLRELSGKNVDEEIVKSNILEGILQIDSSFMLTAFDMNIDKATRKLNVSFTATNAQNETVNVETTMGD